MKGSKRLGKSIIVIAMSLVLMFTAIAPMTVLGAKNTSGEQEYRYYTVKAGDTLSSIAEKNGVTLEDILACNDIANEDLIYQGQVIKIPVTSTSTAPDNNAIVSKVTFKAVDADVMDIVSALAYGAGYTVIYKGAEGLKVSIELKDVSPLKAIDYVTRMVGLSYLKDGNIIFISTADDLNSTFVDSLVLTEFTFEYITYAELISQAQGLGLNGMKVVSQSNNGRNVWISAYPREMAKLHELVEILDQPENISVGSAGIAPAFTPIKLEYISASEFSSLLASLGLHAGITMTAHPQTLFVYASGEQLADIMEIKAIVDYADVGNIMDGTDAPTTDGDTATANKAMKKIDLVNISKSDAAAILSAQNVQGVTVFGHARMTKTLWLVGLQEDVDYAASVIENFDSEVASASSTVHTYTATNCTVDELISRLNNVRLEGVTFYTYDHAKLTNTLIVYCDDVTWNNEVYDLLVTLDTVDEGEEMQLVIASKSGDDKDELLAQAEEMIGVMTILHPDVFEGVEFTYVIVTIEEATTEKAGQYKVVIYAKTTSSKATRMIALIKELENA